MRVKRTVQRGEFIAVLNIGSATVSCNSHLGIDLQFITQGGIDDPSHTGIFGYTDDDNAKVALELAKSVNPSDVYRVET